MAYKTRKKLAPSEEQEARRLHLQGVPLRQIAEQLDSSYGTIQRLIRRYQQGTLNGQSKLPEPPPTDHATETFRRNVAVHHSAPDSAPATGLQQVLIGEAITAD
jgi:transposase